MRLQDVLCDSEPRPHEGTGADRKGHVIVEVDVCEESAPSDEDRRDLGLTDSFHRRAPETKHQRTQPKSQRFPKHRNPAEPVPALGTLEIKEPPPGITRMGLPSCVSTVPPEAETDEGPRDGGCEVACEGFSRGERDGRDEREVGGEGGGEGPDEAADGGCCGVGP